MRIVMSQNIYPKTYENVRALFIYFFPKAKNSEVDEVALFYYDNRELALNEIEFFAEQTAASEGFFRNEFKNGATIKLKMSYVINALSVPEEKWIGLGPGLAITKRLKEMFHKY